MASRFWVGGTASWDGTAGTKWATISGGAGGAAVPTSADDVFLDLASGVNTVTIAATSNCLSLDCTGFTGTLAGASQLNVFGNFTLVAGMTFTYNGSLVFVATATGKTITTAAKTLALTTWAGAGGGWTLQDNFSSGANSLDLQQGTLDTNGKTVACNTFSLSTAGTKTLTMGASVFNLTGNWNYSGSNATINSNTSTINTSSAVAVFNGGGATYNVVSFNGNGGGGITINGANTFATLSITNGNANNINNLLSANQVVTGTFTHNGFSAAARPLLKSDTVGTARTITAAVVAFTDADFQDITGAGAASPFTGTRLGNCKGNTNITFTAAANKFWVGNTANWNAAVWATVSGGAAAANNFPLAQDTCIFDANSFSAINQIVTINGPFRIGTMDFSAITQTGIDLAHSGASGVVYYGDITLKNTMQGSVGGTAAANFSGRNTQTITSAGNTWQFLPVIDSLGGTVRLADALTLETQPFTLTRGTFDMNAKAVTFSNFVSNNLFTRALTSGGATMTLNGNAVIVWNTSNNAGFTLNDALQVDCTYSGAVGTRTVTLGTLAEANSPSIKVSAGTDIVAFTASGKANNLDFTGFAGTWTNTAMTLYGNLVLSTLAMTITAGANTLTMAPSTGIKTITSNGRRLGRFVAVNAPGATVKIADALDMNTGSSFGFLQLTAGTLDMNNLDSILEDFNSSNSNVRTLTLGSGTMTLTDTGVVFTVATSTNLTLTPTTGTIKLNNGTASTRSFNGGNAGLTFGNLWLTGTGTGAFQIQGGSYTFSDIKIDTPPHTVNFTAGTTITVSTFTATGTPGNLITIGSQGAAGTHALTKTGGGQIGCDYLSISQSVASPDFTWYAGTHSTDGGTNTGWIFTDPAPPPVSASGYLPFPRRRRR